MVSTNSYASLKALLYHGGLKFSETKSQNKSFSSYQVFCLTIAKEVTHCPLWGLGCQHRNLFSPFPADFRDYPFNEGSDSLMVGFSSMNRSLLGIQDPERQKLKGQLRPGSLFSCWTWDSGT